MSKKTILLYFEIHNSEIPRQALELCSYAGEFNNPDIIVFIDTENDNVDVSLFADYNVHKCYIFPRPKNCESTYSIAQVLQDICEEEKPYLIAGYSKDTIRDNLSALAAKLGSPVFNKCISTQLNLIENNVYLTKQVFGGKVDAGMTIKLDSSPVILTLQPGLGEAKKSDKVIQFHKEQIDTGTYIQSNMIVYRKAANDQSVIDINDAKVVIAGGRGFKSKEDFQLLEELSSLLNAAPGASRPIVDEGIVRQSNQVGQTGKTIKPLLYMAIGISGAPQHLAGMRNSRFVISINKDPDADIFKYSDYGIVGNLYVILPELIKYIKINKDKGLAKDD